MHETATMNHMQDGPSADSPISKTGNNRFHKRRIVLLSITSLLLLGIAAAAYFLLLNKKFSTSIPSSKFNVKTEYQNPFRQNNSQAKYVNPFKNIK